MFLAMCCLLAQATPEVAPEAGFEWALASVSPFVLGLIAHVIRRFVLNKRAAKALELVATAATVGVRTAWETYTAEVKKASADGKLTDEEKAKARKIAFDTAISHLGADGLALVKQVFTSDLDTALQSSLEMEYARLRQNPPPAQGTAVVVKEETPVNPQ